MFADMFLLDAVQMYQASDYGTGIHFTKQGTGYFRFGRGFSPIGFHLLWYTVELVMSTRLCLL